jgi:hypothetical protein
MPYKRIKLKDIKQSHSVEFKKSERKKFKQNFLSEGYKPKKGTIIVALNNKIVNGNHRYKLLIEKYGEEHKIIVYKTNIPNFFHKIFSFIIIIILLPFYHNMGYKRIKLKKIKQSHCVDFRNKDRKDFVNKFLNEGYIPRKGLITVGLDNKIINGNHRYCLLLQKYGEEHTIVVKKNNSLYDVGSAITSVIAILILPFTPIYYGIKYFLKK